jgi:hypothetical protein
MSTSRRPTAVAVKPCQLQDRPDTAFAVRNCPVQDTLCTVNVPCPKLVSASPSVSACAPWARVRLTWLGEACAIGCEVTFMVTAMVLLSPAKLEPLVVTVPV